MGLFPGVPTLNVELAAWRRGYRCVAGIDEVGRGPLAGPVVAAAAVLTPDSIDLWCAELRDSKMLDAPARERLAAFITAECDTGVGAASHEEIDDFGLIAATKLAMRRAIAALPLTPDVLLIDAVTLPEFRHRAIIHGDALVASIAAASIVAKVARDAMMTREHTAYPHYAFDSNKGYATPEHRQALEEHGPCGDIHRRLFAPVRLALEARGIPVHLRADPAEAEDAERELVMA
jgi:ribonuclease HII